METLLRSEGYSVDDPVGSPYVPGLTVDVIEWQESQETQANSPVIGETVTPIVNLNGEVINRGQVIVYVHSREEV
jgi:hypothetical protein